MKPTTKGLTSFHNNLYLNTIQNELKLCTVERITVVWGGIDHLIDLYNRSVSVTVSGRALLALEDTHRDPEGAEV